LTTDEQAIHEIVRQLETSWNASDSKGFAAPFVGDADFIQIYGLQMEGRPAIDSSHRHIFDTIYKGSHNEFSLRRVRFIRPDVAIAFGQAHLRFYEGGETREIRSRPTMIMAKTHANANDEITTSGRIASQRWPTTRNAAALRPSGTNADSPRSRARKRTGASISAPFASIKAPAFLRPSSTAAQARQASGPPERGALRRAGGRAPGIASKKSWRR